MKGKLVIQRKQREWKLKLSDGSKAGNASQSIVKWETVARVQAAERPPCPSSLNLTMSPLVSPAYHHRQVTAPLLSGLGSTASPSTKKNQGHSTENSLH